MVGGRSPAHLLGGLYETYSDTMRSAPLAWVPLSANRDLRTRTLSHVSELTTSHRSAFASGARSLQAGYVFFISGYNLVRNDENGRFVEEFTSPAYRPEYQARGTSTNKLTQFVLSPDVSRRRLRYASSHEGRSFR